MQGVFENENEGVRRRVACIRMSYTNCILGHEYLLYQSYLYQLNIIIIKFMLINYPGIIMLAFGNISYISIFFEGKRT